jgi:hypothetical protein
MGSTLSTGHTFEPTLDYVLYTIAIPHALPMLVVALVVLVFLLCWNCAIVCCGWQGSSYSLYGRSLVAGLCILVTFGFALTGFLSQLNMVHTMLGHITSVFSDTQAYIAEVSAVCDRISNQLTTINAELTANSLEEYVVTTDIPTTVKSSLSDVVSIVDMVDTYFTSYVWILQLWFYVCIGVVWATCIAICGQALFARNQVYAPKCGALISTVATFLYVFLMIAGAVYLCVGLGVGDFCTHSDLSSLGIDANVDTIRDYYVDCAGGNDPFDSVVEELEVLVNQTAVFFNLTTTETYHELVDALEDATTLISCAGSTGILARKWNSYLCQDVERDVFLAVVGLTALYYLLFLAAVFRNCVSVGRKAKKAGYERLKMLMDKP